MPGNSDLETKIVDAIYRGACDSSDFMQAVEMIARHFESPAVALGELDQTQPDKQFVVGARAINEEYFRKYRTYAQFDPLPRTMASLAVGKAATTDQLFSRDVRRGSVFLHEFLKPHNVDETMAVQLLASGARSALMVVQHDGKQRAFEADDIARFELLAPHFARALQIRRLFLQSEARGKILESIIERNETGMVGLRGDGPPVFVNGAARAVAAARDGLGLDHLARLVATDRAAATRLAALHANAAAGGAGGIVRIPRPSGHQPYVVLVSPLPSGDALFGTPRGGVLFAIHDPHARPVPSAHRIAQLLHIPRGAAKALLEGEDLKDYAERAGISMNTVRFHLKTAFARTETRSQADLVRAALSALNDLGPYFPDRK
jgi:DNA-binding CsgD family transcriptional regulator